jgi:hypothetical protein
MVASFINAGFTTDCCEYLYADNTQQNGYDAYLAFNHFLQIAKGRYIIVCHQDVEAIYDDKAVLLQRIAEVDAADPSWALLGNAGGINLKFKAIRITHGSSKECIVKGCPFPRKVSTLDENFILVKNEANLFVSSNLKGFHLYGSDICQIAFFKGHTAYVIDFHLYHHSTGNIDPSFAQMKQAFALKYTAALRGRYIHVPAVYRFYVSGNRFVNVLMNTFIVKTFVRVICKLKQRS